MTGKVIIQQLVRVFEVKRLTTSRLYDVRRHQLHSDYVAASVQSRCDMIDRCPTTDNQRKYSITTYVAACVFEIAYELLLKKWVQIVTAKVY